MRILTSRICIYNPSYKHLCIFCLFLHVSPPSSWLEKERMGDTHLLLATLAGRWNSWFPLWDHTHLQEKLGMQSSYVLRRKRVLVNTQISLQQPYFCQDQTLRLLAKQLISLASVPFIIKESKTLIRLLDIYIKKVLLRYSEAWFNNAYIRIIVSLKVDLMRNEN